jgi:hypothetical protein
VLGRHAATVSCLGLVWEPETLWDLLIRAFCSVRKGCKSSGRCTTPTDATQESAQKMAKIA